jgi:hypothetical protein
LDAQLPTSADRRDQPATNLAPLSLTSGSVTAANGSIYDMSDAAARQRMMDEGLIYFTDQVGAAIREVDPTALVTVGFFAPQGPVPYRIDQATQNYALVGFQKAKPVLMGEYGTFQYSYAYIGDAASALQAWQIAGCAYHLRGWLLWAWDDYQQPPVVWNDQAGDGSIDRALAPAARPDPCAP